MTARSDQQARTAMINQAKTNKKSPETTEVDKYETIGIIQKNLKADYEEIISEKKAYSCLLDAEFKSPLYHIEKLSELIGKAKAIKTSKVYNRNRRELLQLAIDMFSKIKDQLSLGILDELKHLLQTRLASSVTISSSNDSQRLTKSFSAQEVLNRNIQNSLKNRQFLRPNISKTLSDYSDQSESDDSDDEQDSGLNMWSRNRFSSTSTIHSSSHNSMSNIYSSFSNSTQSQPRDIMPTPCDYASLTNVTQMYSVLNNLPPLPESPKKELIMYDGMFSGHFPALNTQIDELESIQASLQGIGHFDSMDGRYDSDDDDRGTKNYFYNDGVMTELFHPSDNKPNQSIDSPKPDNDEWGQFYNLTQENLAKLQETNSPKKIEKVNSKYLLDDLDRRLKLLYKKVEPIKRRFDDTDDEMTDEHKSKKAKTQKKVQFQLVRKPKVCDSPETLKIKKTLEMDPSWQLQL